MKVCTTTRVIDIANELDFWTKPTLDLAVSKKARKRLLFCMHKIVKLTFLQPSLFENVNFLVRKRNFPQQTFAALDISFCKMKIF